MKKKIWKKGLIIGVMILFFGLAFVPTIGTLNTLMSADETVEIDKDYILSQGYELPPPIPVDMILEESIFRRCSIREFSADPVSDEHLSTILWAAYGYRDDGKRTVPLIDNVHGVNIYVLIKNESFKLDVYRYDPTNHSLQFLKKISSFNFGQYSAPVYIGLAWDTNKSENEYYVGAEIGEIGQNIAFMANALDLGTVVNADLLPWSYLARIGLPPNEIPLILMPLGHPFYPYDFRYRPLDLSLLPRIKYSDMSLTNAINQRNESQSWEGHLTNHEQYQMIWSSYGYSYLLDRTESDFRYHINRHRTVPSAHGYYPLSIYAFTESAVYQYHPNILLYLTPYPFIDFLGLPIISIMQKVMKGDYREDLAQACSLPSLAAAPLIIIPVVDLERTRPEGGDDFSGEEYRWMWYYEAGASAYNVLLEATAWGLSSNLFPIENKITICSLLGLDEDNFDPLFIVPVGK
ncbi:MAG: nitroreductase family protein [Candidatus Thermoplasmatota archaeon]|nr:nitroreductase family protein [Candidatus Thermoplasmatota archaeon]